VTDALHCAVFRRGEPVLRVLDTVKLQDSDEPVWLSILDGLSISGDAALDLNLLRVFNAMMIDLSTVRTGERVGLSQPAVSSALKRLRQIMGDDLFVRDGNRMVPTPKALALREPIRSALQQMEDALTQAVTFDPATADNNFMIAGSDYISTFLMPRLASSKRLEAPGVTVQLLDYPPNRVFELLSEGRVDVAIERELEPPDWIHQETLFQSFVVCIARKGHPALSRSGIEAGGRLPPELYCEIPQVILSTDGSKAGSMQRELRRLGFSRHIGMTVPHFLAIALATAGSDLLGNMPIHLLATRHECSTSTSTCRRSTPRPSRCGCTGIAGWRETQPNAG
jgi:DNA-binding transcriptional LysR family regulator